MTRASGARRARAVARGLLLDRALGEPPGRFHPVAAFGRVMQQAERAAYTDSRTRGVAYTTAGVAIGATAGAALRSPTLAVALTAAGRELRAAAARVLGALQAADLDRARALLPALVGRDPSALDASGIAAAAVESLAENTVDAVVAPACWALACGAVGATTYRAVNTMDAMVGHHSERYERFGCASACLDDVANFAPARLTALLVAIVRPLALRRIARAVVEHAPAHPSPNAGVAEAAFAGALGVELGGPVCYGGRIERRPTLGFGPRPVTDDVARALALASHVELALVSTLLLVPVAWR